MPSTPIAPVTRTCLNGWWDFQPVFTDPAGDSPAALTLDPGAVPRDGWISEGFLVPGWWTKPLDAIRRPGERHWREACQSDKLSGGEMALHEDGSDYLFDAWRYPIEWARTRAGWLRRTVIAGAKTPGRRRHLRLEGVMPRGFVYLNGTRIAHQYHPTLPVAIDVEDHLVEGANELAVRIADYWREPGRPSRTLVPTGNWIPCGHSGIWQDVWLEERGAVRVAEVVIRTSVRRGELSLRYTIANEDRTAHTITLKPDVCRWAKQVDVTTQPAVLSIPERTLTIAAGANATVELTIPWADAARWSPDSPALHLLRTRLEGCPGELHRERFGFREIWIDGPDLLLNGHPIHLFSDWGHKSTPFSLTESWIRQWFAMLKDANLNHSRLHTHPHPPLVLDLADEEGILITGEAGLHGSGGAQAADDPRFWEFAREHVRAFVARDRNRPSVILWSVENEMRWNGDKTRLTVEQLPRLKTLFNELDPTRPAYHEGDSSLWPEKKQDIVSRHYGKECSGLGWWDRQQPLHSGEMSVYHYQGPNTAVAFAGEQAWASSDAIDVAGSLDTAWIVEDGRSLGVCCFGPWNLSTGQNLRPHGEQRLDYADWTTPGVKPRFVAAAASEFRFWEGGAGFTRAAGYDLQKSAFRPLAVIDRTRRSGYGPGGRFGRTLTVVNDTPAAVHGTLIASLVIAGRIIGDQRQAVSVPRGRMAEIAIDWSIPASCEPGTGAFHVSLLGDGPEQPVLDAWSRPVRVDAVARQPAIAALGVFGDGSSDGLLSALGLAARRCRDLSDLAGIRLLIVERNAITAFSTQHQDLERFVRAGGRVLLLEQENNGLPALALEDKAVSTAWIRTAHHPVFAGLGDADLRFWGDGGFSSAKPDILVAERGYRKGDGALATPLADAGDGGMGNGTLDLSPLLAVREGSGIAVACQFLVTAKHAAFPTARRLVANLLRWLDQWAAPAVTPLSESRGGPTADLIASAKAGGVVVVGPCTAAELAAWGSAIGVSLTGIARDDVYQAVRCAAAGPAGVTTDWYRGATHEDGCGIEKWTYSGWGNHVENLQVAEVVLAPSAALEPLWETATESALHELYVLKGVSEMLRATTRTTCLGAGAPPKHVVIGRVRCGAGWIVFDQFTPPVYQGGAPKGRTVERTLRLRNRLRANLGHEPTTGAFTGATTIGRAARSPGHPVRIQVLDASVDAQLHAALVTDTAFQLSHQSCKSILGRADWRRLENPDGVFDLGPAPAHGVRYVWFFVESATRRRNVLSDLGVPNPEALTFCDVEGLGTVQAVITGDARKEAVALPGTITDIGFDIGFNPVLLKLTGHHGPLKLRFRSLMRKPETDFVFHY